MPSRLYKDGVLIAIDGEPVGDPPPSEGPIIPLSWVEEWLSIRLAAFLAATSPYHPVIHPAGPGGYGHSLLWMDQNNDLVADRFSVSSNDLTCVPGFVKYTGMLTEGDTLGVRLTWGATVREFTHTVAGPEDWLTVLDDLAAQIRADSFCKAQNCDGQRHVGYTNLLINPWLDKFPTIEPILSGGVTATVTAPQERLDINPILNLTRKLPPGIPIPPGSLIGGFPVVAPRNDGQQWQFGLMRWQVDDPNPASLKSTGDFSAWPSSLRVSRGAWLISLNGGPTSLEIEDGFNSPAGSFKDGEPHAMQSDLDALTARVEALEA